MWLKMRMVLRISRFNGWGLIKLNWIRRRMTCSPMSSIIRRRSSCPRRLVWSGRTNRMSLKWRIRLLIWNNMKMDLTLWPIRWTWMFQRSNMKQKAIKIGRLHHQTPKSLKITENNPIWSSPTKLNKIKMNFNRTKGDFLRIHWTRYSLKRMTKRRLVTCTIIDQIPKVAAAATAGEASIILKTLNRWWFCRWIHNSANCLVNRRLGWRRSINTRRGRRSAWMRRLIRHRVLRLRLGRETNRAADSNTTGISAEVSLERSGSRRRRRPMRQLEAGTMFKSDRDRGIARWLSRFAHLWVPRSSLGPLLDRATCRQPPRLPTAPTVPYLWSTKT